MIPITANVSRMDNAISVGVIVMFTYLLLIQHVSNKQECNTSKSSDKESLGEGFEQFGNDLISAKSQYIEAKALDDRIFGEDFEI